jgi:hypothetical protein
VSAAEQDRLAALEATLVGAAAALAQKRLRRRRRAVTLAAVVAPLTLAAAGSIAATGFFHGVDHNLSMLRDDRLQPTAHVAAGIEEAMGTRSRDHQSERTFRVGGVKVFGFPTPSGRFCYFFTGYTSGCLTAKTLTRARPVDSVVDHDAKVFRVYGIAIDSVKNITLRLDGAARRVTLAHNAFFFSSGALANSHPFTFTLILGFRDGTTRELPVRVSSTTTSHSELKPKLPGLLAPAEDAAT